MPKFTPHFNIPYFTQGEVYSATFDRMRFTIIDNEMSFIAGLVGDGVIERWNISDAGNLRINVSYGIGIINGLVTFTYGSLFSDLVDNKRNFVWMRRRDGAIGIKGAFSPIGMLTYTDTTPPANTATIVVSNLKFNEVTLTWQASAEVDFDHFDLYQSTDNVTFTKIASPTSPSYVDSTLSASTVYYYKLKVVDVNGNVSTSFSPTLTVTTPADTTVPPDATNVDLLVGNSQLEVVWDAPPTPINGYVVALQAQDSEGQPTGSPVEYNLSPTETHYTIEGLINGQRYQVTLYTVTAAGVRSQGVALYGSPAFDFGPENVRNVSVTSYALDSSANVAIDVSWDAPLDDGYTEPPAYYLITLSTGATPSDPSIYTDTSVTISQYTVKEQIVKLTEDTNYEMVIQPVSADGVTSVGTTVRFRIKKFSKPASPSNLVFDAAYTISLAKVNLSWLNSASVFSYNLLTVKRVNINPQDPGYNTSTTLFNEINVGRSTTFSVPTGSVLNKCRYDVTLVAVDHDGNRSAPLFGSTVLFNRFNVSSTGSGALIQAGGDRPGVPASQDALEGDSQITIRWSRYPSDFVTDYCIYRADFDPETQASDFSKVATVPATRLRWTDYTVENNKRYFYFVTVRDARGLESLNPIDDNYAAYTYITAMPKAYYELTQAPAITASASGHDALLGWEPATDDFDGFEIYRSINNEYSFDRVGDAQPDAVSFTDVGALKLNGTYYYMARKFRNEAEILVTQDDIAPIDSIPLGIVTVVNGVITDIDQSTRTNIFNLEDPVRRESRRQLALPHHPYLSQFDDRRIRLSDTMVVTDWTTTDFITYTTDVDLSHTSSYHVFLGDEESNYNTFIDKEHNQLVFETSIADANGNAPIVSVIFDNLSETVNELSIEQVEDLSAVLVTKGKISPERFQQISHFGRFRERCLPARKTMTYNDGFSFKGATAESITFYDLVLQGGSIAAATSQGIYVNAGDEWVYSFSADDAPNIIYYSATYGWYIASFRNIIYYSNDLSSWTPIDGLKGVNVIRCICEDDAGNIYCSTDAGVHLLNPTEFVKLIWQQLTPISSIHNDAYAMLFYSGTLYVSGLDAIYKTTDHGTTWSLTTDISISVPLHTLILDNGHYFAVSNTNVWRKAVGDSDFSIIHSSKDFCRKIVSFGGVLYLTTDRGLLKTNSAADIYGDSVLQFTPAFANLNRNGSVAPITALKVQGSRLYMGSDNKLHSADSKRKLFQHANFPGACPTFFVNGHERSVGVFYNTSGVYFDENLLPSDVVEVANDYNTQFAVNGGWVNTKYDAQVFVHLNGILKATGKPSTLAKDIAPVVSGITLTSFNARNSNYPVAFDLLKKIVQLSDQISNLNDTDGVSADQIAVLFNLIDQFNANIHPELRQNLDFPAIGANLKEIPPELATSIGSFNTSLNALGNSVGSFDAVAGKFVIATFGVDKYDLMEASIPGVGITSVGQFTHDDLDNVFERYNAGLDATFGFVQESNVLKLLLAGRRPDLSFTTMTESELEGLSNAQFGHLLNSSLTQGYNAELYQAKVSLPPDDWYDKFQSTVDYDLKFSAEPKRSELFYPADIIEVDNEVWVCGLGNIIAIDKNTFATRKVFSGEFYIYNLFLQVNDSGSTVFFLAEDGLYLLDPSQGTITKDVDIALPDGYNSVFVINDTKLIGTDTGVFARRSYETKWRQVVSVRNARIHGDGVFTFVTGRQPSNTSNGQVFYSTSTGAVWNQSTTFPDILINSVAKRYSDIYYATSAGLYAQDIGKLYGAIGEENSSIQLIDLLDDPDASAALQINDVYADNQRVIAVDSTGRYWTLDGGTITGTQSMLPTTHKVRLFDNKFWLFGHDLVQIEGASDIVQLSSGKALK